MVIIVHKVLSCVYYFQLKTNKHTSLLINYLSVGGNLSHLINNLRYDY